MSTVKFCVNVFLVVIFILQLVVTNVHGIPVKKKPPNITRKTTPMTTTSTVLPKSSRPIKKPNTRDPRFLGKFSFLAGLNLPNPPTMSPIHRNDILIKQHVPTQYVSTYNFPPSSWGPFAAAVYEPPPIPSFFEDPLGYLAVILNHYNWINNSFTTTNIPTTITTVVPDKNQDEVFLLVQDSDNEIPNEERMNKIESKMGHQNIEKRKYITKQTPFEVSTTTKGYTTIPYDEESETDLIAEETTTKPIETIRIINNFEDDSRQLFGRKTTHKTTPTEPPTRNTENHSRFTQPPIRPTENHSRFTEPPVWPTENHSRFTKPPVRRTEHHSRSTEPHSRSTMQEKETSITENITQIPNKTSESNSTNGVTTTTTNATSQTPYPSNNATYPIYNHGYYYGGHPQNVSHIELTTSEVPQIDQRIQSFNDVNQYLQPYQPNYQDLDNTPNQQTFDYFRRSEQLPPLPNNYYDQNSKFTFNNMNDNGLNGFKPSFPLLF